MKIAVMGAGGVGGYLGGKLAASGHDVTFIARGTHLDAIKRDGLRIRGVEILDISDVRATDTPGEIGIVDTILFCVKHYDTETAASAIAPMVGENTTILTLQNGIESVRNIGALVGSNAMLGGAAYFPASISAPGEITYFGKFAGQPHVVFGEPGGGDSDRVSALLAIFHSAGIDAESCADTDLMLWEKFLLVAGTSATTGATRCTFGTVCKDPDMRWLLRETIAEAKRVGNGAGVTFGSNVVEQVMARIESNPDGKASLLVDLENGRRLELDGLSGAVVRLGRELDIPTPVHATIYAALKPFRDGQPDD
ncbi:MAG: 2-dehydropantoate 2-reductase [Rhizobiales bacterium]|nr:2-dehydropantoate 2-reductase [Hyphomicrobiales bacterium]